MNIKAPLLLLLVLLASPISGIIAQIPRDKQAKDLKPENAALVGKWQATAKDGTLTIAEIQAQGDHLGIEVVLADAKGKPLMSGRADKVLAIGGFARTTIKMEPAVDGRGKTFKTLFKIENGKLQLRLVDGFDNRQFLLAKLQDDGRPASDPVGKSPNDNAEFTEVANFKCGTQLNGSGVAVLSPDGKYVALAAPDVQHQVVVAEVATQKEERRLDLVGPICAVRWSTDGKTLLAASAAKDTLLEKGDGRQIGLWDTADWKQRTLLEHPEFPVSPVLSRDAGILAVAGFVKSGQVGNFKIWNTASKEELVAQRNPYSLTSMAIAPQGDLLVAAPYAGEGRLIVFDLPSGKQRPAYWKIKESLDFVAITPEGRGLAGVGRSGNVHLFDLRTSKETKTYPGFPGRPHCLTLLGGSKYIAIGGSTPDVHILETRTGKPLHKFRPGPSTSVYYLSSSADASLLLTYEQNQTVRIWKTPFGEKKE
jgi:WD40 repeat protein